MRKRRILAAAHREDNASANNHFGANEATTFKVLKEPRITRIARITLRHEDQACRVRQLLFIRFIRVIRGSIVFGREGGDDFFEARIAAERVPDREQF
jgi:hypothetical protein